MKRAKYLALLLLPLFIFSFTSAQEDPLIPSEVIEDELFNAPLVVDDELIADPEEPVVDLIAEDEPIVEVLIEDEPIVDLIEEESIIEVPVIDVIEEDLEFEESAPILASGTDSSLPLSATTSLSVVNISQNNANATETGARPGDILRYEFTIDSATEDVKDYIAQVDVSGLERAVSFTDVGLGTVSGGTLTFPAFSQKAPCNQIYTFFVQVKEDCGDLRSASVNAEGKSVAVSLNCGLSQTGPSNNAWAWAMALILAALGTMWISGRKTS